MFRGSSLVTNLLAVACIVMGVLCLMLAVRVQSLTDLVGELSKEPVCPCPVSEPLNDWDQADSVGDSVAALSEELDAVQAEQERLRAAVQEAARVHDNRPGTKRH